MIEKPPKEMRELIKQIESFDLKFDSILMPLVISIMPDITPSESPVFSGNEPKTGEISFAKNIVTLSLFKMPIKSAKKVT